MGGEDKEFLAAWLVVFRIVYYLRKDLGKKTKQGFPLHPMRPPDF